MFLKCIINQAIIEGSRRLKSIETIRRYLSICYGIRVGYNALMRRKGYLRISGKLPSINFLIRRDHVQQNGKL